MPEDVVKGLRDIVEETAEEPKKEESKEPEKQWGSCYPFMRPRSAGRYQHVHPYYADVRCLGRNVLHCRSSTKTACFACLLTNTPITINGQK